MSKTAFEQPPQRRERETTKDLAELNLADMHFLGEFHPGIKSSHPKFLYEDKETGLRYIVKKGPVQSVRADFVSGSIFSRLDIKAVDSAIVNDPDSREPVLIMPDLSADYKPLSMDTGSKFREKGLKLGDFLKDPELQEEFKSSILAALLTGDYDRVPWNVMLARDGSDFVNTDFGASLGARARGGYNSFLPNIDSTEINLVLRDPYDILPNANELYADLIEVTDGEPNIKDRKRLAKLADQMKERLTDTAIDDIINKAGWPDNSITDGKSRNIDFVNNALVSLRETISYASPKSLDYIKSERAIKTYEMMRDNFDWDPAAYFSFTLKARRDDLIKLFGPKISDTRGNPIEPKSVSIQEGMINEVESLEVPSSLRLFIVRHGASKYLERVSVKKGGEWDPNIYDLKPEGEKKVLESAESIAKEIDPQKNIVVFLSSPRARALRSMDIIGKHLRSKNIDIYERGSAATDILRSGGDNSPTTGEKNSVDLIDRGDAREYDIDNEGEEPTEGKRFKSFLSFFNAIDQKNLIELIKKPGNKFHGKIPVFVVVTHGEVLHGNSSQGDKKDSFLGKAFPENPWAKLSRGEWMKIDFNIEHQGDLLVTIPAESSSTHQEETKKLHFDVRSGDITIAEQDVERESNDIDSIWEKIDTELPTTLEGTNFKIPYEQIPVRQLITRAEFAREIGKEAPAQSFVSRKISRKSFQHPLSQEEYVAIKSNRGNSPQLLFSYPGESGANKPEVNLDNLPKPEDIVLSQKSKYRELMDDKRSVKLSRIVKGANIKGQEDQSFYYLDTSSDKPKTEYILREQAWNNPDLDFVTRGFVLKRNENSPRSGILFCKAQSSKLDNDTLFFAVEYSDGKPVNTITKNVSLKELPIFDETLRERPEILFKKSDLSEITDFSGDLTVEGVTMNFPGSFNFEDMESFKAQSPITLTKAELPEDSDGADGLEVHIDPEVDSDLDTTLKNLKKNLGKHLLEVYFYGSIPRGYKRLQSDIDLLAVVSDKESAATGLGGFESEPFLMHDALGTHTAVSSGYPYRNIEVHTIKESKFKKPDNLRLGEFLRNALDGAIRIL